MSTSGPRYHIPFPTAFLSLNTPRSKLGADIVTSPEAAGAGSHSFLSNRSGSVPRHSSISSVSSSGSTNSVPTTPESNAVDASPVIKQAAPTFLALNSKFTPPPVVASAPVGKSPFLSNRH